ncbi:hypothetical protein KUTeg_001964 [Tegillarca granosa]|uniref:Uncharacterized protein n=1 Tax=Tegillarca granosa TaxID=220873 RepID=A0ABQ9FSZ4_TEGGR|nr:hypothetical protein KUTeg_001964 [Tegillarca granosa]
MSRVKVFIQSEVVGKCQSKADDVTRHSSAEMAGSITDSQSAICVSCVTDSRDLSLVSQSPLENNEDPVVGKLVSLKTRCLYQCIVARASWNAQVHVTNEAINEIMNLSVRPLNEIGMDLIEKSDHECVLFCDASSFGYCGHLSMSDEAFHDGTEVIGMKC